jgi:maleate isomerase
MGGVAGAEAFRAEVRAFTGLEISCGSFAVLAALQAYGADVRRLAFVSPYYPAANAQVRRFLQESGFEVVRDTALRCASWTDIARVDEDRLRQVLAELDGPDVDAIIQVGTNLSMQRLAAQAERALNKPVIAINTATYWHALRANGIADRMEGFGHLMARC